MQRAEIAAVIGAGHKTVANTFSRIKMKLGAARTAHLVRMGVEKGRFLGVVMLAAGAL